MMSMGALTLAISLHLVGPKPELAMILTLSIAGGVEPLAHPVDGGGGDAGAGEPAQLLLGAVGADRLRRVALEHGVGLAATSRPST